MSFHNDAYEWFQAGYFTDWRGDDDKNSGTHESHSIYNLSIRAFFLITKLNTNVCACTVSISCILFQISNSIHQFRGWEQNEHKIWIDKHVKPSGMHSLVWRAESE